MLNADGSSNGKSDVHGKNFVNIIIKFTYLAGKGLSLKVRGIVYTSCVRSLI